MANLGRFEDSQRCRRCQKKEVASRPGEGEDRQQEGEVERVEAVGGGPPVEGDAAAVGCVARDLKVVEGVVVQQRDAGQDKASAGEPSRAT